LVDGFEQMATATGEVVARKNAQRMASLLADILQQDAADTDTAVDILLTSDPRSPTWTPAIDTGTHSSLYKAYLGREHRKQAKMQQILRNPAWVPESSIKPPEPASDLASPSATEIDKVLEITSGLNEDEMVQLLARIRAQKGKHRNPT
jgi:hypothetical protein